MRPAICLTLAVFASGGHAVANDSPHDWLDRMSSAVQTMSYAGTVVRQRHDDMESLKVAHAIENGIVRERMVSQEGTELEIVRVGNEVHCILPDKKTVLVEQWNDQSTLFSTLPDSDLRFGNEYDVAVLRHSRVAGRKAVELAIRPHDNYRYGHRLWLDLETAFPLKTQLLGDDGSPIEQVRFVEISLNSEAASESLVRSYATDGFTWLTVPDAEPARIVESDWQTTNLPPGFTQVSVTQSAATAEEAAMTHIMYSDGLANVSAFIEPARGGSVDQHESLGASSSFSFEREGWRITVVGEVPAVTVEQIARSLTLP